MRRDGGRYAPLPASRLSVSEFRGIDLCNSPTNVSMSRSPDAPNMIRDVPGKVRKRMGYHKLATYAGRINGVYLFAKNGVQTEVIHAGTGLYAGGSCVYGGMRDGRSTGWQLEGTLFICDGKALIAFDGETAKPAAEEAYVPQYVIGRQPGGGGTVYEPLNLIGTRWRESFLADGSATLYQLSFDGLDSVPMVEQMTADGVWRTMGAGTEYSADVGLGRVVFVNPPPVSPVSGADNIRITAQKTRPDYAARINSCRLSVLYGVAGAADRLFVSGNPAYPCHDWYSEMGNARYFPLTGYSVLGFGSEIGGYSIISDRLAVHKRGDPDGRNIILREGRMVDGKAAFPVVNTLQGAGIASGYTVAYLKTEPLFFSPGGIFAVTPADTSGERYSQNRSFFINSALERAENREDSAAVCFRDFYLLSLDGRVYVLDSLMKSYERGAPYSTHQYEAYLLEGIDARVMWVRDEKLRFGTSDGKIMEFYTDSDDPMSYNDDGAAICAHWDTPMLSTEAFYSKKSFRYMAVRLLAASVTGLRATVQIRGQWHPLFAESARFRFLDFNRIDFSKMTFSGDMTPQVFGCKIHVNKVDKARFRLENRQHNEPFGLYNLALELVQHGKKR